MQKLRSPETTDFENEWITVTRKPKRGFALLVMLWAAGIAQAAEMNMRVVEINDHLLCFYDGRPPEPATPPSDHNWADFGAFNVGVATYVIHRGTNALVYDTYPGTRDALWVRNYLQKLGLRHFTVVNSHWHLDHVGGNAVYSDSDRIATLATIRRLTEKKDLIESAAEWGPPAIKPLVLPNVGISAETTYYVGDIEVMLRPINIHSADGLVAYLPVDRILLAGDTLEDTLTFVAEPDQIPTQIRNLEKMRRWNIDKIFPNHGNPDVIANGGYPITLIDATVDYLHRIVARAHDPHFVEGPIESYVGDSVSKGWVSYWWAYREAHKANLQLVEKAYKDRPLPTLPPH
jgi:glyoxylase-like metal-dependent hydrolase (beta-lactamase superfamily II)